jgi:hypothetical protein
MYYRARYYDPETGEFVSQDPLDYVDGMSQYRGYFVPGAVDSSGQDVITVKPKGDKLKKIGCGGKIRKFHQIWTFKVPKREEPGWVVQKVTVIANKDKCFESEFNVIPEAPDLLEPFSCCLCVLDPAKAVTFTYFEAWRVKGNREYPSHPKDYNIGVRNPENGTDKARLELPSEFFANSCGSYTQKGEIKFYSDSQVNGEISIPSWSNNPTRNEFGPAPWTTGAGPLWARPGPNPPTFWSTPSIASGDRLFSVGWRCCDCDPDGSGKIWGDASPKKAKQ